jgi:hypothetical protein
MKNKQDRNAYMKEYMKKYRATMNEYTYKKIRERENQRLRQKYHAMSQEEKNAYYQKIVSYKKKKSFINE